MINIKHGVIDQCIIHIINRNRDGRCIGIFIRLEGFDILNICHQHTCNLLLKHFIAGDLQILIDGKIYIISLYRIFLGIVINL